MKLDTELHELLSGPDTLSLLKAPAAEALRLREEAEMLQLIARTLTVKVPLT